MTKKRAMKRKTEKTKAKGKRPVWKKFGDVMVDSGQLMIVDPCYVESHWVNGDYVDIRLFKNAHGKYFAYETLDAREFEANEKLGIEFFANFQSTLSTGKTPSQHIESNEWTSIELEDDSFSYNGVCHKGSLPYKEIQNGLALCFQSGYGDGVYAVYGRFDENNRIIEVRITMDLGEGWSV